VAENLSAVTRRCRPACRMTTPAMIDWLSLRARQQLGMSGA
jgi:hypothetical protein